MTYALALPNTDWLAHRLLVSGPVADVAAFRAAAAGAGAIPWQLDLDGLQEEWFLRMLAPAPAAREISVEGARILAETYRDLVGARHDRVLAAVGRSRACPLDLHALLPVPDAVLQLGPDDPASLDWLWTNWGTTRPLKQVVVLPGSDRRLRRSARIGYSFFSADWTPWPAIQALRTRWPGLVLDVQPNYGDQENATTAGEASAGEAGAGQGGRGAKTVPNRKRPRKASSRTRTAKRAQRRTKAS